MFWKKSKIRRWTHVEYSINFSNCRVVQRKYSTFFKFSFHTTTFWKEQLQTYSKVTVFLVFQFKLLFFQKKLFCWNTWQGFWRFTINKWYFTKEKETFLDAHMETSFHSKYTSNDFQIISCIWNVFSEPSEIFWGDSYDHRVNILEFMAGKRNFFEKNEN